MVVVSWRDHSHTCDKVSSSFWRLSPLFHFALSIYAEYDAEWLSHRLIESEDTVQKRLAWAEQQVSTAASPGLFSCTIQDSSPDAAYDGLKHAVATLSPFVRNKLQGLPADVLDYADLIASNSVEQALLKPVLISGQSLSSNCYMAPSCPCSISVAAIHMPLCSASSTILFM